MNIWLFNGPPGCGKDTAAKFLLNSGAPNMVLERMSFPNKRAWAGTVNVPIDAEGNVTYWESVKEEPIHFLAGKSYRNFQQDFSEKFMKPHYGEDIFAKLFVLRNEGRHSSTTILVPDCGFEIELDYLVKEWGKRHRIFLVRIHRDGKTFAGDTRSYLYGRGVLAERTYDVLNNDTLEDFKRSILQIWSTA